MNKSDTEFQSRTVSAPSEPDCAAVVRLQWLGWTVVLLPFGYLWFRVIDNVRLEWSTNPQYSYGWVVPLLCIAFLLQRWHTLPRDGTSSPLTWRVVVPFVLLAFLFLPTHLVEEATPEWRPIQWSLATEAAGLTLCAFYAARGGGWLRQVAFPICFFFVAIPWPTIIENPLIQSLTRVNSGAVVEILSWLGIPSMQHGNLIEVSTGTVGVSEACSGIRSFQTSLMVSLFFGEYYGMRLGRRLLLVPLGFLLAMAFNVCRMSFLTIIAAKKGVDAIAEYHDPAGVLVTIVCTAGLWGLAMLIKGRGAPAQAPPVASPVGSPTGWGIPVPLVRLSIALCVWLVAVEAGVELWYRNLESHRIVSPNWQALFPLDNPTYQEVPITSDTENLLRYDDGKQGTWVDADGFRWQAFYFNWRPGRVAGYLAKRHTPEICLPATGCNMVSGPDLHIMNVNGVGLPVRSYVFEKGGEQLYVFHCRWEAGVGPAAYITHESARFNLVRGIWAGRGKFGQKILEIIVSGCPDFAQAKAAFTRQLPAMIDVKNTVLQPAQDETRAP